MTIEWKMSNSSTSVESIGCLLWNICAVQGTSMTLFFELLLILIILDVLNMQFHRKMTHKQVQAKDS